MDSLLHLVGLSRRAGRLAAGEEPVRLALQSGAAALVLAAGDAAENSVRRCVRWAGEQAVPCCQVPHSKEELGAVLGRTSCAMAAINDPGLAAAAARALSGMDQARYGALAEDLSRRAEEQQKAEKACRAKERERLRRQSKPWAPPPNQSPGSGRKKPGGKTARHGKG